MKLFHNAKFWHKGSFSNDVKAILTKQGKIEKLLNHIPEDTQNIQKVDLKNSYVYPGFIDTHTHSFEGGLYSLMIDLREARSIKEVLDMIREGSQNKGKFVFAWNFDENRIEEKRFPTRAELNSVVRDKNLVLRRVDGHSCAINSFACFNLKSAFRTIRCDTDIQRGLENDTIVHWFHNNIDSELILRSYHAASDLAIKGGFTTIHTMVGDANMSIGHYSLLLDHLNDFAVDYVLYPQSFNIEAALEVGAKRIGGCILADGSIGSYTAALFEPYQGLPIRGNLYQTDAYWYDFISRAHQNNLQVAVHCIGDRAINQINTVYMALANSDFRDLRHQLIHCEITDDTLINHIKASQAVPVVQPMFDQLWGGENGFYARALGKERSQIMNRFSAMVTKGITITGSSDWYITDLDIRKELDAAMNHHNPAERLTPAQAIDLYTKNAAWLSHDEALKGQIKEGLYADFTILNYDLAHPVANPLIAAIIKRAEVIHENFPTE